MSAPVYSREQLEAARHALHVALRDSGSREPQSTGPSIASVSVEHALTAFAAVDAVLGLEPGPGYGPGVDAAANPAYRAGERNVFSRVATWLVER